MFNGNPQDDSEDDVRSDKEKAEDKGEDTTPSDDNEETEARKKAFQSIRNSFGSK